MHPASSRSTYSSLEHSNLARTIATPYRQIIGSSKGIFLGITTFEITEFSPEK